MNTSSLILGAQSYSGKSEKTVESQSKPEFSVRIVVCDHYLTKPIPGIDVIYSDFRGSDIKQIPVFRIFGSAPDGHKACLHVHGVFPYFYVPCPTSNPQPQFLYQIAASLDKALNIALKQASSVNQHVFKISLVKGLPFYGYHDKEHLYLKIFLYNPGLIKQAVELCSNGAILGQVFQPHESHLNFTLQFFIDFNLFGMSNIDLQTVKFRRSKLIANSNEPLESPGEFSLKPESICHYEADCVASHIINRQRIGKGEGIENPGLEEVWNQELERRKQLNISMASKSLSQGRLGIDETESHYKFENMFLVKMSNLIDKPVTTDVTKTKHGLNVSYPAETAEDSQLFNASDVSTHIPMNPLGISMNRTITNNHEDIFDDSEKTIVDEDIALNSSFSLHYSQVVLDNADLELVDMLQNLEEAPIDEDSVMGTPANADVETNIEADDAEYSQIFNEETILMEPFCGKDDDEQNSSSWNDSFWEGANIPQLDGTCDDDHVKKVRKRKMRPFKLGLSRPKNNKTDANSEMIESNNSEKEMDDGDEINASRETIESISDMHFKRSCKVEDTSDHKNETSSIDSESILDLVNKLSENNESAELVANYDVKKNYIPKPGPSKIVCDHNNKTLDNDANSSIDSPLGIESFYNASKFDVSLLDNDSDGDNIVSNSDVGQQIRKTENEVTRNSLDNIKIDKSQTRAFNFSNKCTNSITILTPKIRPASKSYITSTFDKYKIPKTKNPEPYFSNHKDVGEKVVLGQMVLKVESKLAMDQKPFDKVLDVTSIEEWRQLLFLQTNEISEESTKPESLKLLLAGNRQCILTPVRKPPTRNDIELWDSQKKKASTVKVEEDYCDKIIKKDIDELDSSQAIGLNEDEINSSLSLESGSDKEKCNMNNTLQVSMQPDGSFLCFGSTEKDQENAIDTPILEMDFLTIMLAEVHTSVRGDLNPDPAMDAIQAIFVTVTNNFPPDSLLNKTETEILIVDAKDSPKHLDRCVFSKKVTYVNNESEIFEKLIALVQLHDPDIMCGYEMEMNSWGYILERSQNLGFEMIREISRITEKYRQKRWRSDENEIEGRIIGRITFNVWRLFRHELALSSYSFENCMYEILKERVPKYTFSMLSKWWDDESRMLRWIPVEYYLTKLSGTVKMLEKLDIINRTSELARLFGLQWWEVLSRGSQFRVESLMLRAARPLNLVALSPTVKQRAAMRAPECLPLIFEPESRFYTDPVIVLDFQSLYPSMMIAYNYCFSTCIGRVQNIDGESPYEFGAWRLRIPKAKMEALVKNGLVHWSPVGVGFVKKSVRRGVLPALLRRILAARQAVKKSMKMQTDEAMKKAMHSRQLGLKLIANVTYGYTAANFSGRMPCVEVGDSVVAKGRETLERAIKLVRNNTQWNVKVVYGDTDSMFVQVPGGTRAEAFEIGQQIADAVTADNPSPVALKLEKVYQPCILQTKKRYVGYMYESAEQQKPVYEAKGIETVRRDGCPAGVELLQRCLCELFESGDMSRVKAIARDVLSRLADGRAPPHQLFFTREYHGPAGYRPGAAAPPYEIAKREVSRDRRGGPRPGARVAWQVAAGAPGVPLVRLARSPRDLLADPSLTPHVAYYAARVLLPPLHRCLSLLGVDVFRWWSELGWSRESQLERGGAGAGAGAGAGGGIARYMERGRCAVCGQRGARALCGACALAPRSAVTVAARLARAHAQLHQCYRVCNSCCGHSQACQCENTECPMLWRSVRARQKLEQIRDVTANLPPRFTEERLDF